MGGNKKTPGCLCRGHLLGGACCPREQALPHEWEVASPCQHAYHPIWGDQGQFLRFAWILTESAPDFSNSVKKSTRKSGFGTKLPEIFRHCRKNIQIGPSWKGHKGPFRDPVGILRGPLKEPVAGASLSRRKSLPQKAKTST